MSATVGRAPSQPLEALRRGNEKVRKRIALRRAVASGEKSAAAVILDPPEFLRTVHASAKKVISAEVVLSWQPRWGAARAKTHLNRCGVRHGIEIHNLSPATRKQIVEKL